jgi:prevent-host-death family protein
MHVDTRDLVSVTEASNRGLSKLVARAEEGRTQVLLRNNKPIAAIVDLEHLDRLERIDELEDDLRLLTIALARAAADSGRRRSLNDVLAKVGIDRAELVEDED